MDISSDTPGRSVTSRRRAQRRVVPACAIMAAALCWSTTTQPEAREPAPQAYESLAPAETPSLWATKAASEISRVWAVPYSDALAIVASAVQASAEHRVDPTLTLAVMAVESGFDAGAVSPAGATGPMQVIERWHLKRIASVGAREGAMTADQNIRVGVGALREYMDRERGNIAAALQRYNGSLDDETRSYSQKVLQTHKQFRAKFGEFGRMQPAAPKQPDAAIRIALAPRTLK